MSCATAQEPTPTARVWIFTGIPGDEEHHELYETLIAKMRQSFTDTFAIPPTSQTVLYGPKSAGYEGPCTREALLGELAKVVAHTRSPDAAPAWIIFLGHASAITGGAALNLPGPDLSARELGDALKGTSEETPLVVFATHTLSAELLRPLAAPGRIIVTATNSSDKENETEFPNALAEALASNSTDADGNGTVSVTELFLACDERVKRIYEEGKYLIREHAQIDGDGDGIATSRPAPADADAASRVGLKRATATFD